MKTKHKILAWLGTLFFIGLFVTYAFELKWLENTFDAGELVWKSIVAGVSASLVLAWSLRKYADDFESKIRLWASCILMSAFFSPLVGSLSNRLLSPYAAQNKPFEFFEEKPFVSRFYGFLQGENPGPDGYYIFIVRNGEVKRFRSNIQRFEGIQRGGTVELKVKKGRWGFEVVQFE